jgi:hypothetical protein
LQRSLPRRRHRDVHGNGTQKMVELLGQILDANIQLNHKLDVGLEALRMEMQAGFKDVRAEMRAGLKDVNTRLDIIAKASDRSSSRPITANVFSA